MHAGKVQETLIDGIHLHPWRHFAQHIHHPCRDIAVQRVIAAEHLNAVRLDQVADLEVRLAHTDAQRLGLVAAAHHTAIVVTQHHHRQATYIWTEQPLAAHIEVIAVHQRIDSRHAYTPGILWMQCTTTPKISSSSSWPRRMSW